jgi:hypothetical protein
MPVAKSLALATALLLELTTLADTASRASHAVNRFTAPTVPEQYRLKAVVATVQIHELGSLRSSRISTDPLVGEAPEHATDM